MPSMSSSSCMSLRSLACSLDLNRHDDAKTSKGGRCRPLLMDSDSENRYSRRRGILDDASTPFLYRTSGAARRSSALANLRQETAATASSSRSNASGGGGGGDDDDDDDSLSRALALLREHKSSITHEENNESSESSSSVFLVGTGPGDVGMLTLRAASLMASADVILYDRLVSEEILKLCNPSAVMVYVGKASGFHTRSQEEIHQLMLAFAQTPSTTVVRLKGGDPCVFGRGGEEFEFLSERGIGVHVVPGITAAAGISASVGVPLTHRGVAASVRFLTGHLRADVQADGADGEAAGAAAAADAALGSARTRQDDAEVVQGAGALKGQTLVVYMGLQTLPHLIHELVARGAGPSTPAMAVENGTTEHERRVFSPMHLLPDAVKSAELRSPTLVVIGEVVSLSKEWRARDEGWTDDGWKVATGAHPSRASDFLDGDDNTFHDRVAHITM